MALIRWEPVRELNTIQNEMNRLFNTFFDTPQPAGSGSTLRRWLPAMDLLETQDDFVLRADLPGLSEGDVNIELEDNVLTVSGERKAEQRKPRKVSISVGGGAETGTPTIEGTETASAPAQELNGSAPEMAGTAA